MASPVPARLHRERLAGYRARGHTVKCGAGGHVLPELVGSDAARELLKPTRGRPRSTNPKDHVKIRLDADVLAAFKRTGSGCQTRLNSALRNWLSTHA